MQALEHPIDSGIPRLTLVEVASSDQEMSLLEAKRACQHIRSILVDVGEKLAEVRQRLWEIRERRGWAALGYKSMLECWQQEFALNKSQLYRYLDCAEVEVELFGEVGVLESVSHGEILAKLPAGTGARARAYELAQKSDRLSNRVVQDAVNSVKNAVPSISDIHAIFSAYGVVVPVKDNRASDAFKVVRRHPESPDEKFFRTALDAWEFLNGDGWLECQSVIDKFGVYQAGQLPIACASCAFGKLRVVGQEKFVECQHSGKLVPQAEQYEEAKQGCFLNFHEGQEEATLSQIKGVRASVMHDGMVLEGVITHVTANFFVNGYLVSRRIPVKDVCFNEGGG